MHAYSPLLLGLTAALAFAVTTASADDPTKFTETFDVAKKDLSPTGKSAYFVLEPGFVAVYDLRLVGHRDGEHGLAFGFFPSGGGGMVQIFFDDLKYTAGR